MLTYMIHLGYLGYNETSKTAFVPNEEILLVGINYDKNTKEHQCLIERYEKMS